MRLKDCDDILGVFVTLSYLFLVAIFMILLARIGIWFYELIF